MLWIEVLQHAQCVHILDHTEWNSFLTDEGLEVDWWTGDDLHDQHENEVENDRPRVHH